MEANVKTIIFLFVFILIGVVLFEPIINMITYITTPGTYTTVTSGTAVSSSFVPNPAYVGSNNAPIVSLVPVFYLIVLIVVPAVVAYKIYKE
jgi:hypothetical protein